MVVRLMNTIGINNKDIVNNVGIFNDNVVMNSFSKE
jgi:hypothetical protein